jgi:glyoxylase-like metal-dependent hydrolase (beta-lactamase superfamily II)
VSDLYNIVNVGYRSTNFWVISKGASRILVDLGWPGRFETLRANLKRADIRLSEIKYALATHYHIDHAGCAQELKEAGVPLLVLETQAAAIPLMKQHIKPQDNFLDIRLNDNVNITFAESRALLAKIDICGEIVPTPGHSDDSVSLVLDDGSTFIGDLTLPQYIYQEDDTVIRASWRRLRDLGARTIYAGHGPVTPLMEELEI